MFIESNPMPVKWLLNYLGLIGTKGSDFLWSSLIKNTTANLIEVF